MHFHTRRGRKFAFRRSARTALSCVLVPVRNATDSGRTTDVAAEATGGSGALGPDDVHRRALPRDPAGFRGPMLFVRAFSNGAFAAVLQTSASPAQRGRLSAGCSPS